MTSSDWIDVNMNSTEFQYQRMKALSLASKIFIRLGNTATGVQRRWTAHTNCATLPPDVDKNTMDKLLPLDEMTEAVQFSHPDPKHNHGISLTHSSLQVTGSWCKLEIPKDKNIHPRLGFGSFIWKSMFSTVHNYIADAADGTMTRSTLCRRRRESSPGAVVQRLPLSRLQ